jgi:protein-serine/threonine kinase
MKILQRSKIESANLMKYAQAERNVMSYIRHPYIVSLRYAFQTSKTFVLVMTFCPGGSLQQLLKRESRLSISLTRHYLAEVLLGLGHLHENKILYRDLKPENIVLDEDRHAMITDFGLSKEAMDEGLATSFLGSICFLAPEILERAGHNHTVDIDGLGVLAYNMITGRPPFYDSNRKKMWDDIRKSPLIFPRNIPEPAVSFMQQTMKRAPSERLGADATAQVQTHVFFESIDFEALENREVPVPDLPSRTTSLSIKSGAQTRTSHDQQKELFGRAWPGSRAMSCMKPPPVEGWDYAHGRTTVKDSLVGSCCDDPEVTREAPRREACVERLLASAKRALRREGPSEQAPF